MIIVQGTTCETQGCNKLKPGGPSQQELSTESVVSQQEKKVASQLEP